MRCEEILREWKRLLIQLSQEVRRGRGLPILVNGKKPKTNLQGKTFSEELSNRLCQNIKRSRAAINEETVNRYFDELKTTLEGIYPGMIVNYDETNMTDDPGRKKVIVRRGMRHPERIIDSSKASTSVMFAGSAD